MILVKNSCKLTTNTIDNALAAIFFLFFFRFFSYLNMMKFDLKFVQSINNLKTSLFLKCFHKYSKNVDKVQEIKLN
jgi:hypothetical protein